MYLEKILGSYSRRLIVSALTVANLACSNPALGAPEVTSPSQSEVKIQSALSDSEREAARRTAWINLTILGYQKAYSVSEEYRAEKILFGQKNGLYRPLDFEVTSGGKSFGADVAIVGMDDKHMSFRYTQLDSNGVPNEITLDYVLGSRYRELAKDKDLPLDMRSLWINPVLVKLSYENKGPWGPTSCSGLMDNTWLYEAINPDVKIPYAEIVGNASSDDRNKMFDKWIATYCSLFETLERSNESGGNYWNRFIHCEAGKFPNEVSSQLPGNAKGTIKFLEDFLLVDTRDLCAQAKPLAKESGVNSPNVKEFLKNYITNGFMDKIQCDLATLCEWLDEKNYWEQSNFDIFHQEYPSREVQNRVGRICYALDIPIKHFRNTAYLYATANPENKKEWKQFVAKYLTSLHITPEAMVNGLLAPQTITLWLQDNVPSWPVLALEAACMADEGALVDLIRDPKTVHDKYNSSLESRLNDRSLRTLLNGKEADELMGVHINQVVQFMRVVDSYNKYCQDLRDAVHRAEQAAKGGFFGALFGAVLMVAATVATGGTAAILAGAGGLFVKGGAIGGFGGVISGAVSAIEAQKLRDRAESEVNQLARESMIPYPAVNSDYLLESKVGETQVKGIYILPRGFKLACEQKEFDAQKIEESKRNYSSILVDVVSQINVRGGTFPFRDILKFGGADSPISMAGGKLLSIREIDNKYLPSFVQRAGLTYLEGDQALKECIRNLDLLMQRFSQKDVFGIQETLSGNINAAFGLVPETYITDPHIVELLRNAFRKRPSFSNPTVCDQIKNRIIGDLCAIHNRRTRYKAAETPICVTINGKF